MTSLRDIRVGLAASLATLDIRAHDTWPAVIVPPAAIVRPLSGSFHDTFDDDVVVRLELTLLLQLGDLRSAQEQLDAYIAPSGSSSIKALLEADPSLGDVVHSVAVSGWRDYGILQVGENADARGPEFIGCKFDVEIFA
jgi:hypothetical protein